MLEVGGRGNRTWSVRTTLLAPSRSSVVQRPLEGRGAVEVEGRQPGRLWCGVHSGVDKLEGGARVLVPVLPTPIYTHSMSDIALAKGEKFLEDNAKKEGVTVTASGLQYKVITPGTGKSPKATDTVEVHYEGTLIDGTVFDSSYRRKESIEFPLNRVIAGWTEGVQLMQEGAKYRFYIPSKLAYGPRGAGRDIGPNEALIFDVELIKVK